MARLLALAVFLINMPRANAFAELFENRGISYSDPYFAYQNATQSCSYSFGWGRSSVTITRGTGEQSSCTFSHTERLQGNSSNPMNSTYIHNFTCTDGSAAKYWTNFFGVSLAVRHFTESQPDGVECR